MTSGDDRPGTGPIELEPDHLDGHTLDELTDYLEAGRVPADPSIDGSPACRLALDALERLHGLTPDLIAADTEAEPEADDGWVRRILGSIALEAHAGRRIPLAASEPAADVDPHHADPDSADPDSADPGTADRGAADLAITEGAVRGLVRAAENAVPGLVVGRCRFDGDVTRLGAPVRVLVDVSVPYGRSIRHLVEALRTEIAARLAAHTELNVTAVDITVRDVRWFRS